MPYWPNGCAISIALSDNITVACTSWWFQLPYLTPTENSGDWFKHILFHNCRTIVWLYQVVLLRFRALGCLQNTKRNLHVYWSIRTFISMSYCRKNVIFTLTHRYVAPDRQVASWKIRGYIWKPWNLTWILNVRFYAKCISHISYWIVKYRLFLLQIGMGIDASCHNL